MKPSGFRRFAAAVRGANWWYSKIPPMLAAAYTTLLVSGSPVAAALPRLLLLLVAICGVAAYGHVINDIFDIEEDRRAGKPNAMAARSVAGRVSLISVFLAMSLVPLWLAPFGAIPRLLIAANLLLPTLYSLPGVRLKERGVPGILADAGAAHALPAVLFTTALWPLAPGGTVTAAMATVCGAAAVLSLAVGLRGIITHQAADRASDLRAGVATFARRYRDEQLRTFVFRGLFPVELAAGVVLIAAVAPAAPVVLGLLLLYGVMEWLKVRSGWTLPLFPADSAYTERYVPLLNNELYELWLPLALALQLAVRDGAGIVLLLLQPALFYANYDRRVRALAPLARQKRDTPRPRTPAPKVILGASAWTLNGVNVFSANLARRLQADGCDVRILLTEEDSALVTWADPRIERPDDIVFDELPVRRHAGWGTRWGAMIRYLESEAPCVFVPNSDWRHSCVCPLLSDRVAVVGIVHSDDPLHYDHVSRLGCYWNAIVAVSDETAARTRALLPDHADRIVTIPIGVHLPDEVSDRCAAPTEPLRVLYLGLLKQHQKRVFDLPSIMHACVALGVPVTLTIAGDGPDADELRARCADLTAAGRITFTGVIARERIAAAFTSHDVFIMTSEFEGMPNALLEAMAHGCVPLATAVASGITQVVRDGETGLLVPVGHIAAFAERIAMLHSDPQRRMRLARAAQEEVRRGYSVQHMASAYRELFGRVMAQARAGSFHRPRGLLSHPPATVAGVSVFPVDCTHDEPGLGRFPAEADARRFRQERDPRAGENQEPAGAMYALARAVQRRRRRRQQPRVVVATSNWARNGVNRFAYMLVHGLLEHDYDARILLTEERTALVQVPDPRMPLPDDVRVDFLPVARNDGWGAHWGATLRYLEDLAPCIYISNYDWRHATVVPRLSPRVRTIGVVHGADPLYLDHAARMARYWDAIVAVSGEVLASLRTFDASLADRAVYIPHGVDVPRRPASRANGPLRVLVDLTHFDDTFADAVAMALRAVGAADVAAEITVVAESGASAGIERAWACASGRMRLRVLAEPPPRVQRRLLDEADAVLVPASVDFAPLATFMARGCIPVVLGAAGSPLIQDRETGRVVAAAEPEAVARCLAELARDHSARRQLAFGAYDEARELCHSAEAMVEQYVALFRDVCRAGARATRPAELVPPPATICGIDVFPVSLEHAEPGIGPFPTAADAAAFHRILRPRSAWMSHLRNAPRAEPAARAGLDTTLPLQPRP